jgi:hypothetical protein
MGKFTTPAGMTTGAMSAFGRYCCRSILSILSRNIDSRSGANAQQRFKGACAPIRSLQTSISQSLLGDFCNNIGTKRRWRNVRSMSGFGSEAEMLPDRLIRRSRAVRLAGSIQNDSGRSQGLPADFAARSSSKIDRMQEE